MINKRMSSPHDRTLRTRQASMMRSSTLPPSSLAPAVASRADMHATSTAAAAAALASQQLPLCHGDQEGAPPHALLCVCVVSCLFYCFLFLVLLAPPINRVLLYCCLPPAASVSNSNGTYRFKSKRNKKTLPKTWKPQNRNQDSNKA